MGTLVAMRTAIALIVIATDTDKPRPDLLVADFEGADYGAWTKTGQAFGAGPAKGTLPGQMPVSGYIGSGLVNSFGGGDASTGTLTSPPFRIERRHINFLIGGGGHVGKTCINLVIDGQSVRAATGPNTQSGGSERLEWASWDVREFVGTMAAVQVVDAHTGGWGHINIDHIVQSDRPQGSRDAKREIKIERRYLHVPVKTGEPMRTVTLRSQGRIIRRFDVELSDGAPSFIAFTPVDGYVGHEVVLESRLPGGSSALERIVQSDALPAGADQYNEPLRPQFHFTSRRGWFNDPNGLVFFAGQWHLFYQHNPFGWNWGNMHWGHAISDDLLRWREQGDVLFPVEHAKGMVFSGSAIVDWKNTSGYGTGADPPLVIAFTDTEAGESLAYSNDRGRSWTRYAGNPVVKHQGRDPRLFWHEPRRKWIMAVYDEFGVDAKGQLGRHIAFHSSANLRDWQFESRIEGYFECPDIFEIAVRDCNLKKWVLYAADGKYAVGEFDGRRFVPDGPKQQVWFGRFYAAQTYSDAPDGRRVQIGWANGVTFPGMPFNQQMCLPAELELRETANGLRLFVNPVRETQSLRDDSRSLWKDLAIGPDNNPVKVTIGDTSEIDAQLEIGDARIIQISLRGVPVIWSRDRVELQVGDVTAPFRIAANGQMRLRIFQDRGSVEVFGNDGQVAISAAAIPSRDNNHLELTATGGEARLRDVALHKLRSCWR